MPWARSEASGSCFCARSCSFCISHRMSALLYFLHSSAVHTTLHPPQFSCPHYFTSSTVQLSRVSVFRFLWLSKVMDEPRVSRPVAASISSNTQRTEHPICVTALEQVSTHFQTLANMSRRIGSGFVCDISEHRLYYGQQTQLELFVKVHP